MSDVDNIFRSRLWVCLVPQSQLLILVVQEPSILGQLSDV